MAKPSTHPVEQLLNEIRQLSQPGEMPRRVELCEQALALVDREQNPEQWADLQNRLGNSLCDNPLGDRADNIERAIAAYEAALQVYTREALPQQWAMTQNNLAIAYWDRIRGDRAENIERAISAYEAALQVYTREALPQQWAMTQNNLGTAYRERIRGDRADNIERAIAAYEAALQVYTREALPQQWAMTQGNLARALMDRAQLTENPADLDTAISLLREALEIAAPGSSYFINDQYTLGNALFRRYEQNPDRNLLDLEAAVQAYEAAFTQLSPEHYDLPRFRERVGQTQSALGALLVQEGKWHQGLEFLLSSLDKLRQGDDLLTHANALYQTGRAHELLSNMITARTYYRDALRLYQHLNDREGIARSRARLGSVLVSCGYLERGIQELTTAQELYHQLNQPQKAAELTDILNASQNILEQKPLEEILDA